MAITIKPALRKNPQDKAAAAKYYAQVVLAPEMKQKQIVDQIADRCTLTGSDIKAVLDALMVVIKRNLANGSPVRLGDLGSFRPSVSGKGTEDASKCGASSVKKHVSSMFLLLKSRKPFQCILSPRQEQAQRTKMAKAEMRNQIRNLTKAAEKLQTRQLKQ